MAKKKAVTSSKKSPPKAKGSQSKNSSVNGKLNGEAPKTSADRVRERLLEKEKKGPKARAKAGVDPGPPGEWPDEKKVTNKKSAAEQKKEEREANRHLTRSQLKAKYDRSYGRKFDEVLYEDIGLILYRKFPKGINEDNAEENGEMGPLDATAAAELIGWTEEGDEEGVKFGNSYKFKHQGNKVRLLLNPTNRPFRKVLAMRYANEILRGQWKLNGESIVLDKFGRVQSGQHRLVGVILADAMLKEDVERWSAYGWNAEKGVFIETVLVAGIDPSPEVVDTIDVGQKRSLGDVIFRNDDFVGSEKDMAKMSNALAGALRLVWLRSGGVKVSDAPHFPHSEALLFLKDHPKLKECVEYIMQAEGGGGKEGKKISAAVSLAYAAGTMYLMATSKTDREDYDAGEMEGPDFTNMDKAKDFWQFFAANSEKGKEFPAGHPIKECRKRLSEISAGDGAGRDEIIGTIAKAFNHWMDGKKFTPGTLKLKRVEDEESGTIQITEDPRMGGLDVELED